MPLFWEHEAIGSYLVDHPKYLAALPEICNTQEAMIFVNGECNGMELEDEQKFITLLGQEPKLYAAVTIERLHAINGKLDEPNRPDLASATKGLSLEKTRRSVANVKHLLDIQGPIKK